MTKDSSDARSIVFFIILRYTSFSSHVAPLMVIIPITSETEASTTSKKEHNRGNCFDHCVTVVSSFDSDWLDSRDNNQ